MAAIAWERQRDGIWHPRSLRLVQTPRYRRRRLVALVLVLALTLAVTAGVTNVLRASSTAGSVPDAPLVLVARPGDSYWTLANRVYDGGDLRSYVDELVAANGGRDLRAGDRIVLR